MKIVSVLVIFQVMKIDKISEVKTMESKEELARNRTLRNAARF